MMSPDDGQHWIHGLEPVESHFKYMLLFLINFWNWAAEAAVLTVFPGIK